MTCSLYYDRAHFLNDSAIKREEEKKFILQSVWMRLFAERNNDTTDFIWDMFRFINK